MGKLETCPCREDKDISRIRRCRVVVRSCLLREGSDGGFDLPEEGRRNITRKQATH